MSSGSRPIHSVLIANRGEVAVRVAGTLRSMGIRAIVVYTEADRGAPFTRVGDIAVPIGGDKGYIDIAGIVAAAKKVGADAIHPGYGFLAESAPFAAAVTAAGIIFIGPKSTTISELGSKIGAKRLLSRVAPSVPLVPGYYPKKGDPTLSPAEWRAKADAMGYPVLIKAAAGGGGKGMRVVRATEDFESSLDSAKNEAKNSFGDDAVMLEKYFEGVRHIEVQILGDSVGTVDHLGERECSVQRRHQKLLEESPSPALSEEARAAICAAAVEVGKSIHYEGAGTVEFIVESTPSSSSSSVPKFYFLEVNTRLQVEHAVSEQCRGVDIVRMQVLIASGFKLADAALAASRRPLTPSAITAASSPCGALVPKGYSIEARVYAEDDQFMPCVGEVTAWSPAPDVAFYHSATDVGSKLGVTYDGLICKVISYAEESRQAAHLKLVTALQQLVCFGVYTNRSALINLLNSIRVKEGDMTTDMIDKGVITGKALIAPLPSALYPKYGDGNDFTSVLHAAAAITVVVSQQQQQQRIRNGGTWSGVPSRWSNNAASKIVCVSKKFVPLPRGSALAPTYSVATTTNAKGELRIEVQEQLKDELKTHASWTILLSHISVKRVQNHLTSGTTTGAQTEKESVLYEVQIGEGQPLQLAAVQVDRNPKTIQSQVALLPDGGVSVAAACHVQFLESGNLLSFGYLHRLATVAATAPAKDEDSLPGSYTASSTAAGGPAQPGEVRSPIPAKVVKVPAANGSQVKKGDVVVVLESMKMERKVMAPNDGKVHISLKPGDLVQAGNTVFRIE